MLIEGVFAWAGVIFIGPLVLVYLRRRHRLTSGHLVAVGLFLAYVTGVVDFTLLPMRTASAYDIQPPVVVQLFFLGHPEVMSSAQYAGNVLLGLPFGFLLPLVRQLSLPKVAGAGLAFSVAIEGLQWVASKAGLAYLPVRVADINDVFLNTLGTLVGLAGLIALSAVYRRVFHDSPLPGPWEHFHRVLAQGW